MSNPNITKTGIHNQSQMIENILPSEYTALEYIEGTGTQYINTEYAYNSTVSTYKIECEWEFTGLNSSYQAPYGAYKAEANNTFRIIRYNSNTALAAYSNTKAGGGVCHTLSQSIYQHFTTVHTINTVSYNEIEYSFSPGTAGTATSGVTFYVMAQAADSCVAKIKLWYFRLSESDELKVWLVPAKRNSDNVIGMYDLVRKSFYVNNGTGTFASSPDFHCCSISNEKTKAKSFIEY